MDCNSPPGPKLTPALQQLNGMRNGGADNSTGTINTGRFLFLQPKQEQHNSFLGQSLINNGLKQSTRSKVDSGVPTTQWLEKRWGQMTAQGPTTMANFCFCNNKKEWRNSSWDKTLL
ncbi:hypothetical protein ACA910_021976 [Epithemia clementina (nom. ined.)]